MANRVPMLKLTGTSSGRGMAMGTAAVIRPDISMFTMPARVCDALARSGRDTDIEPVDLVLIARDYSQVAISAPSWARIVGIALENPGPGGPPPSPPFGGLSDTLKQRIPIVTGIGEGVNAIEEDSLVLIDGDRGLLLIDPTPAAVAAYQSERESVVPRKRYELEFDRQPARTIDGRVIQVLGRVREDSEGWRECAADGLYVYWRHDWDSEKVAQSAQLDRLLDLALAASGRPIVITSDLDLISPSAILQAAARGDFRLAIPTGGASAEQIGAELDYTRDELAAEYEDLYLGHVSLALYVRLGETQIDSLDETGISRIVVEGIANSGWENSGWLRELFDWSTPRFLPVEIGLPAASPLLETAIGLGAAGLIVEPSEVSEIKNRIRDLNAGEILDRTVAGID